MTARIIVYFQCLDNPLDAAYTTPIDELIKSQPDIVLLTLDNFSMADQFALASKGLQQSSEAILIVTSEHGSGTEGLFPLINKLVSSKGKLFWIGDHPIANKATAMAKGMKCEKDELSDLVNQWINEW